MLNKIQGFQMKDGKVSEGTMKQLKEIGAFPIKEVNQEEVEKKSKKK
jgi:hypothetical protein